MSKHNIYSRGLKDVPEGSWPTFIEGRGRLPTSMFDPNHPTAFTIRLESTPRCVDCADCADDVVDSATVLQKCRAMKCRR